MEIKSRVRLDLFNPLIGLDRGASKHKEAAWYFFKILFFTTFIPFPSRFKVFLLRSFGATIGNGVVLKPRINIHMPWKLKIGNNVWIGEEVFILNFEEVAIGNNVCISQRAFLCGGNHNYKILDMPYRNGKITLNDGCWIGANVFISPSVEIGIDSVITACSVITKSVPPNSIFGGNPSVFIKTRWS